MDSNLQIIIERLLLECKKMEHVSPTKRRYSSKFKKDVKLLFEGGINQKEIYNLIPVSKFSINKWTSESRKNTDFKKITVSLPKPSYRRKKYQKSDVKNIILNQKVQIILEALLLLSLISLHLVYWHS